MDNYPKIDLRKIVKGVDYGAFYKVLKSRPEVLEVLSSYDFEESQIEQILEAFSSGLTLEQIKSCATPDFDWAQMREIFNAYNFGLSSEEMNIVIDPDFSVYQMEWIINGFKNGWKEKMIKLYAKMWFDIEQMKVIYTAIRDGLGIQKIRLFASPEFSAEQMEVIRSAFDLFGKKASYKQVRLLANPNLSVEQMSMLKWAYEKGLTIREVKNFAKPDYTADQMREIIDAYLIGCFDEQMAFILNPKLDEYQMNSIQWAANNGLTNSEIATFATGEYESEHMEIIAEAYYQGYLRCVPLLLNPKVSVSQADKILMACKMYDLSEEQLAFLSKPENDCSKMDELARWFMDDFSVEQVQEYADKFNSLQLAKIRYGLKNELKYLDLWVKPEFSAEQMQEIIYGIENGYTKEQLLLYVNPKIPDYQMADIRLDIEIGIPNEKVACYAGYINRKEFEKERTKVLTEEIQKLIN